MELRGNDLHRWLESYDPHQPLIVAYGDVIAARNAVAHLIAALRDEHPPLSEIRKEVLMRGVAAGVAPGLGTSGEFAEVQDTVEWLVELRARLGACLPWPGTDAVTS